jgi:hypothetical protein
MMNEWTLKDMIKKGTVPYSIGDEVVILKRKSNGHPRSIKHGITYIIKHIDFDGHLIVAQHSTDGIGYLQSIRVHKMYVINKSLLRDIKLNSLLDETNGS